MSWPRHPQPVVLPDPTSRWETHNVFTPAGIYQYDLFHMINRAQGRDWISRLATPSAPMAFSGIGCANPIVEDI